ncbi:MAG: YHS domain-containing protein [Colwellia sp.]|jgi:YHS domain-containing protein
MLHTFYQKTSKDILMNITALIKSVAIATTLAISSVSFAADISVSTDANDLAIYGYDAVSYFADSKATKGNQKYTATYKSAIYQFSSAENRNSFKQSPEKFVPQFGGYCAMGVALNKKLETDPTAWKVVEGKLYLNLNTAVQKKWSTDISGYITTADRVWSGIQGVSVAQLNAE